MANLTATACFGNKNVSAEDLQRAIDAALVVFAGRDPTALKAEFDRQWDNAPDDSEDVRPFLSGDALVWLTATEAADEAFMPHSKGVFLRFD